MAVRCGTHDGSRWSFPNDVRNRNFVAMVGRLPGEPAEEEPQRVEKEPPRVEKKVDLAAEEKKARKLKTKNLEQKLEAAKREEERMSEEQRKRDEEDDKILEEERKRVEEEKRAMRGCRFNKFLIAILILILILGGLALVVADSAINVEHLHPHPTFRRRQGAREAQMTWEGPRTLSPFSSSGVINLACSTPMTVFGSDENPNFKSLRKMMERMKEMSQWCDQVTREGDREQAELEEDDRSSETRHVSCCSKRLRSMKERTKEMSQWWDQVMREGEEEQAEEEEHGGSETRYNSSSFKIGSETEIEEAVSVESVGD